MVKRAETESGGQEQRRSQMMKALEAWIPDSMAARSGSFQGYVQAIAHARYVVRRIVRILDEQAREHGLEPLQHQALLQVYGSRSPIPVNKLASRLDIAAAFASRIVSQLHTMGLVERRQAESDRRLVTIVATEPGIALVQAIDSSVYRRVRQFQGELAEADKLGALGIFAFYVGLDGNSELAAFLRESVRRDPAAGFESESANPD
jgi:DNA-binding MarR family transcriptional regulator